MSSAQQDIPTDRGTLSAYVARPDGPVRGGPVLLHEVWGLVGHTRDAANRLACEGYVVVAPDLLVDKGIAEQTTAGLGEALAGPDAEARNQAQPGLRALLAPLRDPGAGHAFNDSNRFAHRPAAAHDARKRALDFPARHLA